VSVASELTRLKRDIDSLNEEIAVNSGPRAKSPLSSAERRSVRAFNAHNFALRVTAGNYLDGILRQFEDFCEHPLQLAISCTFDWFRSNSHL